jgi:hypothetical protein
VAYEDVPGKRASDPSDLLLLTPVALNVLLALADGERHGYGIMLEVRERTGGRVRLGPKGHLSSGIAEAGGGVMVSPLGSRSRGSKRAVAASERAYRSLLRAYPRLLRDEMARCFRDLCREALATGGELGLAAQWLRTLPELLATAFDERSIKLARNANRAALGVALAAAFILIWMNLAVGVIGTEDDRANLMYVGVLAIGVIGAIIADFRPDGMARALFATALAQAVVAAIAVIFGLGAPWSEPREIVTLNGFFVALFVGSALLVRYAARALAPSGAGPES